MFLYDRKSIPYSDGNYNSQGFIMENEDGNACTGSHAVYNTGVVSFTTDVYIANITKKQYIYCEGDVHGNRYYRAFCVGVQGGNEVFVEINSKFPIKADYVETVTAPFSYTLGWNTIGAFSDASGTNVYNAMYDGTTASSGTMTHKTPFVDDDSYIT
mmetsp:Transcript_29101/g.33286  ORF Transcript_29101/g.33286 Transcript_29101/m.33286 type:complete len:157 (-) Transcript_29101:437-907(-)